jgi:LacI family transcriptional regulator
MARRVRINGLAAVADAAGVSPITVSRVFREAAHVAPDTRERVLSAAKRIGYRPDPVIARLMSVVRGAKQRKTHPAIGVVRDDTLGDDLHDPAYQYVSTYDIRSRAERHGYLVEEFSLGRDGLTPRRLTSILRTRGIEGLVISPQSSRLNCSALDYRHFATATLGYGLQSPYLHRACTHMWQGILGAAETLTSRGYRRIGLAITDWIDARLDHTYSGALLFYQQGVPLRDRVPRLIFPANNPASGRAAFCSWMKEFRPDVVISFHRYVPEWLKKDLGLQIPEDIGLVVHDWTEAMRGFAGINHCRPMVAAAAVDLVATQLMQNERGIPEIPKQILVRPTWVDGPSIR